MDRTQPTFIDSKNDWSAISVSGGSSWIHTLALRSSGKLWSWDSVFFGSANVPTQVGYETDWSAVAAGDVLGVLLKSDRSLWTWDYSGWPERIGVDNDWVSISAKTSHYLAVKADGSLWAWGDNSSGQLGSAKGFTPGRVGTESNWGAP